MTALNIWNGGVIVISHDERFITTVAKEVSALLPTFFFSWYSNPVQLWVCGDGTVTKFHGDVQSYKVCSEQWVLAMAIKYPVAESYCEQSQSTSLRDVFIVVDAFTLCTLLRNPRNHVIYCRVR